MKFYLRWRATAEAKAIKAPNDWNMLRRYPNNFKLVRVTFLAAYTAWRFTKS